MPFPSPHKAYPTDGCPFFTEIASAQNQRFKHWLKLLDAKGVRKAEEAIIAGRTFLEEILKQFPEKVIAILVQNPGDLAKFSTPLHIPAFKLSPELFARLDIYGTKAPLLVIKAPPLPRWEEKLPSGLTLFLPFQNPINLGTTIRTAAAIGAEVVLLQEAASPYLPKALRAAGPAIFQTPLWQGPSLENLADLGKDLPIYALSPHGDNIYSFTFPETVGLVAGMEGPGLDAFWPREKRLSIPMRPYVESLNAAIAVAMAAACLHADRAHNA